MIDKKIEQGYTKHFNEIVMYFVFYVILKNKHIIHILLQNKPYRLNIKDLSLFLDRKFKLLSKIPIYTDYLSCVSIH